MVKHPYIQRSILVAAALALYWAAFYQPPLTLAGKVDARVYCREQTNRQDPNNALPTDTNGDGKIDWADSVNNPFVSFDWTGRYQHCLSESSVDSPRLALTVAVIVLICGLALLFLRTFA